MQNFSKMKSDVVGSEIYWEKMTFKAS